MTLIQTETKRGKNIWGSFCGLFFFLNMGLIKISIFVNNLEDIKKSSVLWIIKVWEWSCFDTESWLRLCLCLATCLRAFASGFDLGVRARHNSVPGHYHFKFCICSLAI